MAAFPDLKAHSIGRDIILAPLDDIGDVLMATKQNKDSIVCCLAKAARIIRKGNICLQIEFLCFFWGVSISIIVV